MVNSKIPPLFGLVLAGGKSTRMGRDKSLLEYHGKPQVEFCYELLSEFCNRVFISNRVDQSSLSDHRNLPQMHDVYHHLGPIGGILTAMEKFPDAAWLVLSCDLPFMTNEVIQDLINARDASKYATTYHGTVKPGPEPLCAIYEPVLYSILRQHVKAGLTCPREILMLCDVVRIRPKKSHAFKNINSWDEYQKTMKGRE